MIRYTTGNILDAQAEALVNTVNCVGIMGRGIALQFKNAFPQNFKAYAAACARKAVEPGRMFVFDTGELTLPRYIVNFPTKRHWRGKSRIEDIASGLESLVAEVRARGIRSIAVPPLGSGLGGLDWAHVKPLIERAMNDLGQVDVLVYEPSATARDIKPNCSTAVPKMTAGRAALVSLMDRYLGGLMDPTVSLLEVHKLMYFLQRAGEPLKLRYVQAPYGPYAENLRHVLHEIEGHLISGYADGGDAPDKQLTIVPGAAAEAQAYLSAHRDTQERFEKVARLVEGFESSFGLELLATVHWVMAEQQAADAAAIEQGTYAWGARKRQFSPAQIDLAARRLRALGWVSSVLAAA
jgi:O-acetyl-ADP-ribose deacetylase (regulator of RNase III)